LLRQTDKETLNKGKKGKKVKRRKDMKKYLIAIAMVLTLSMNADAAAQRHRHTPRTEQTDSTKNNPSAIEAFSDTTTVADSTVVDAQSGGSHVSYSSDDDVDGILGQVFGNLDKTAIAGMFFAAVIVFIIFVLAPILIIIAVFYFINKNRKDRIKLAQMAMEKGQPIPDELLKEKQDPMGKDEYQTGIRQMFTGVGLAIFLGLVAGKIGFGIGALVFCIGLGKWFIARQSGNVGNNSQFNNTTDINNNVNHTEL
jgi:uncharacterized membrane protein